LDLWTTWGEFRGEVEAEAAEAEEAEAEEEEMEEEEEEERGAMDERSGKTAKRCEWTRWLRDEQDASIERDKLGFPLTHESSFCPSYCAPTQNFSRTVIAESKYLKVDHSADIDEFLFPILADDFLKYCEPDLNLADSLINGRKKNLHSFTTALHKKGRSYTALIAHDRYTLIAVNESTKVSITFSEFGPDGVNAEVLGHYYHVLTTLLPVYIPNGEESAAANVCGLHYSFPDPYFKIDVLCDSIATAEKLEGVLEQKHGSVSKLLDDFGEARDDTDCQDEQRQKNNSVYAGAQFSFRRAEISPKDWHKSLCACDSPRRPVVAPPRLQKGQLDMQDVAVTRQQALGKDANSKKTQSRQDHDRVSQSGAIAGSKVSVTAAQFRQACAAMKEESGFSGVFIFDAFGQQQKSNAYPETRVPPHQIPKWLNDLQKTGNYFKAAFGVNFEFTTKFKPGRPKLPWSIRKGCILAFSPDEDDPGDESSNNDFRDECTVIPFSVGNPYVIGTGLGGIHFKFPRSLSLEGEANTHLPYSGTLYLAGLKRSSTPPFCLPRSSLS